MEVVVFMTKNKYQYLLGCHLSSSKGYRKMGETAIAIKANTFQFFSRNPRGGSARSLNQPDLDALSVLLKNNNFGNVLVHSPYTLNMASANPKSREFAKMIFKDDMERMNKIPCNLYNFHPGSHSGQDYKQGINQIVEIINATLTEDMNTIVLLETMSGKGSEIGRTFEELRDIIDRVKLSEKMGVCLDTCHLYSAGYDIVNKLESVLEALEKIIGISRIKAVHLNDSMHSFNSKKDRHAEIGKGSIGLEAIVRFIKHPQLKHLPFILETPLDTKAHGDEIAMLREILS